MFLIKKISFYIFLLSSIIFILVLGITSFSFLDSTSPINEQHLKFFRENILFLAIVFIVLIGLYFFKIVVKSQRIYRELDKIYYLSKTGSYDIENYLNKMGQFGDKLYMIYNNLNALNRKQSLKINSQSNIIKFMMNNIDLRIVLMDARGKIISCSEPFIEYFSVPRAELLGSNMADYTEFLNMENLIYQMEHSEEYIAVAKFKLTIGKIKYNDFALFYPIFNFDNYISHIAAVFDDSKFLNRYIEAEDNEFDERIKKNNLEKINKTQGIFSEEAPFKIKKLDGFINFIKKLRG